MTIRLDVLLLAAGLNAAVALAALWRRSVSRSGAVAGFLVGSIILATGGFAIWGMLMLFFVSASVVSRVGATAKKQLASMHEKGSERDAIQVLANGGAGLVGSILLAATGEPAFAVAAAGGFAAANADTWAGELGVLSPVPPRSIVSRRELPPGASGGVTRIGTLASVAGSALIAVWFVAWGWAQQAAAVGVAGPAAAGTGSPGAALPGAGLSQAALLLLIITAAGAIGSLIDSLLGATIQALYRTDNGSLTEKRTSGTTANTLIRGFPAVTNDIVNSVSTMTGAVVAGVLAVIG